MLGLDLHLVARPDPEDEAPARDVVDGSGRHRDRRRGADEHAGDAGAEPDPRGPRRGGGEDRELIAAMPFRHPGQLVAEALGEHDAVDDLGRAGPAGKRDTEPFHTCLPRFAMNSRFVISRGRDPARAAAPHQPFCSR